MINTGSNEDEIKFGVYSRRREFKVTFTGARKRTPILTIELGDVYGQPRLFDEVVQILADSGRESYPFI